MAASFRTIGGLECFLGLRERRGVKRLSVTLCIAILGGSLAAPALAKPASAQVPTEGAAAALSPLTLVADLEPHSLLNPETLRLAIARELGRPVVWERDAKGGTLVIRQEGARVVVSFDSPDGLRHDGRSIPLANEAAQAERDIALLAGNVARDQA